MLTVKTQEMDKVTGLLVGADDYITKLFSPSELMARIDAITGASPLIKRLPKQAADKATR